MSAATPAPAASVPDADRRRTYRIAGASALVAAAGYVAIPVLRAAVAGRGVDLSEYPTPVEIGANLGLGVVGLLTFGTVAVAVGLATLALTELTPRTLASRCAAAAGITSALGFALAATGSRAMYSFVTANLTGTGADESALRAAVWAINVLSSQTLVLAAGLALFTAWLVFAGGSVLPTPVSIVAGVLGAGIAAAVGFFTFLPAQFLYVPLFALIGVSALLRSRSRQRAGSVRG